MQKKNNYLKFKGLYLIFLFVLLGFQNIGYSQNNKSNENKQNESQEDIIIRVDTNLVTVPVTVFDRAGRYVTNLKREDFQILEDGIKQEIVLLEPIEESFTVFILLDVSGSMINYLSEMANASSIFLKQLRPNDQIIAAGFGEEVKLLSQLTKVKDMQSIVKLRPMSTYKDTMVYDAVQFSQKKMKKIHGRKAIVLFSDGIGSGFWASAKSTLRDAEEQDVQIYTVQFAFSPPNSSHAVIRKNFDKWTETATNYMQALAAKTGGRHYLIKDIVNLEKSFQAIADELSQQYNLGYYPTIVGKSGERRQIKVKVNMPNVAVRARDSYIVGSNKK